MKRRTFFAAAAGAGLARPLASAPKEKAIIELSYIRMRNSQDRQRRRTSDFLNASVAPAMKRAGSGPVGLFTGTIGEGSPYILVVASYPGLAGYESVLGKIAQDKEFGEAAAAYYNMAGLGFQRVEKSLLLGFETVPDIEAPPTGDKRPSRIFELRTYESDNFLTLARKVGMFNGGEIGIFRRLNMLPVFFGETIVGPRMPNLTYMLAFDSMAAREKAWSAFRGDPEWKKMSARPEFIDPGLVSNISNSILQPLPGSDIR